MRRRAAGEAVRGSSCVFRALSKVVTLTITEASPSSANARSKSRSRSTPAPLVTMLTGWRYSSSVSNTRRVTLKRRSPGWYGSVLVPIANVEQT